MTHPTTITAQPGDPFLEVRREFDATPAQVFRAYTDPELVTRWLGPRELDMQVLEYDIRTGGSYHYVHRNEHMEQHFRGVCHTVVPAELIIQTFEWAGAPHQVSVETLRFHANEGRTEVRTYSVFPSTEAKEQALANGMSRGISDSMDRLGELLAEDGN